jgi:hypothetical protein
MMANQAWLVAKLGVANSQTRRVMIANDTCYDDKHGTLRLQLQRAMFKNALGGFLPLLIYNI